MTSPPPGPTRSDGRPAASVVLGLAGLALGTAVGLGPLALGATEGDPFDAGSAYLFWLFGGAISAALVAALGREHWVRQALAVAAGFPLAFVLLVALTPVGLPSLFPLTVVLLTVIGAAAAVPGAALGRRLAPFAGGPSAEGRAAIGWALIAAGATGAGVFVHRATVAISAANSAAVVPADTASLPLRVLGATLSAQPADYHGRCPTIITFRGRIHATGGRGRVSYRFLRSDEAVAPIQTVEVDRPISHLETTWTLGGPTETFEGWQALQILEPQAVTSVPARFRIRCGP
jgi:hypothetical protein